MWKVNLVIAKALNSALSMTVPVMVGFLGAHGISLSQFALLKIYFNMAGFVFEIPLGIVSDCMGRKTALVLAGALNAGSAAIYLTGATSFWWFALAEVSRAIGMAFLSGTDEALAYEKCREDGTDFNKFWPFAMQSAFVVEGLFWGAGMAGVVWGTVWQFKAALILHILQMFLSAFLPETMQHELGSFRDEVRELALLTREYFFNKGLVRRMMIYGAIIPGVAKLANFLIEPVLRQGLTRTEYAMAGVILALSVFGVAAIGKKVARPSWLFHYGIAVALLFVGLGLIGHGIGGGILLASMLAILQVSLTAVALGLNPLIDNTHRATILSYRGGVDRLVSAAAWAFIGVAGITSGSIWLGAVLLVLLVATWRKG